MRKFAVLVVLVLLVAAAPALAQTPTPTPAAGEYLPPGWHECEDLYATGDYGVTFNGTWSTNANGSSYNGYFVASQTSGAYVHAIFWGDSLTLYRWYYGAADETNTLCVDSFCVTDVSGEDAWSNNAYIYRQPAYMPASSSGWHTFSATRTAGRLVCDALLVRDTAAPAAEGTAEASITTYTVGFFDNGADPAVYNTTAGGQPVAVGFMLSAGDVIVTVFLFGIFCLLAVIMAVTLWTHSRPSSSN